MLVGVSCALAEPGYYRSYGHYGGYGHHGHYGKREAGIIGYSAYASPLTYSGAYGYAAPATGAAIAIRGYGTPATIGSSAPYGYAASGAYVADSVGAVHVAKREADAEPGYAYASPLIYSGAYGYASPATGAAIAIRGYGTPATIGSYAPYGYAASGSYVADSVGAVHVA